MRDFTGIGIISYRDVLVLGCSVPSLKHIMLLVVHP